MWKEPLGGKPISPYELRKINPRYKGVSPQKILEDQRKLGLTSEKQDYTKIDPDIECAFQNIFKRVAPSFEVKYIEGQGRNITKKVTGHEFLKEDVNRLYAWFKECGLTQRGRKRIKDDLILLLVFICSRKYPEIHKGLHKFVTRKQVKAAYGIAIYLLDLGPNYVYFPFVSLDKHIWDFSKHEKHLLSFRTEIFHDKDLMPLLSGINETVSCFMQTLTKVYLDLVKSATRPGKKISVDWICLATHIYCFKKYQKKANVKLLKTNAELSDIWDMPPRTLNRRLNYLKRL